ncbi:MAG: hypothetical protein AAF125_03485 [Chloroflexota bacterium]
MTFVIKQVKDHLIWVATYTEPYNPIVDAQGAEVAMKELTADVDRVFYYIADLSQVVVDFNDIVLGLAEAFKPGSGSFYSQPNVRILTVGTQELIQMAAVAAKQDQYGGIDIKVYASPEEAIAHAKAMLAAESV